MFFSLGCFLYIAPVHSNSQFKVHCKVKMRSSDRPHKNNPMNRTKDKLWARVERSVTCSNLSIMYITYPIISSTNGKIRTKLCMDIITHTVIINICFQKIYDINPNPYSGIFGSTEGFQEDFGAIC